MKMAMKQQGSIAQMNKKSLAPQMSNIKFDNIAGYDEVKAEL
jgi:ATP-dependent Zn protease